MLLSISKVHPFLQDYSRPSGNCFERQSSPSLFFEDLIATQFSLSPRLQSKLSLSFCSRSRLQCHHHIFFEATTDCFEVRLLSDFQNGEVLLLFICFLNSLQYPYLVYPQHLIIVKPFQNTFTSQLQVKFVPSICS